MRQKSKQKKEDEELRTLSEQNRMLKAKEAAIRNSISRIKATLLKILDLEAIFVNLWFSFFFES